MISTADREHVSMLTAMMYPGLTRKCDHCDGYVTISTDEVMSALTAAVGEPYASLLRSAADPSAKGVLGVQMPTARGWPAAPESQWPDAGGHWYHGYYEHHKRHGHRHHDHCGCGREDCHDVCKCRPCRHDDCHCQCCIVDADLVVHARLFERRLVPIVLENDRRREKEIELDLSEFRTKGGTHTSIVAAVTPTRVVLGPCEEREVIVVIDVRRENGDDGDADKRDTSAAERKAAASKEDVAEPVRVILGGGPDVELIDVDECVVAYGDLRIVGCDVRPVRIAVSILPRDCHAHRVRCSCGCC